jgi:hypothetical protein
MMRLMNILVHARMMLEAMNPINGKVVERHVQQRADHQPAPPPLVRLHILVQQAVAADLGQEDGARQEVDEGHGEQRAFNLLADLVLEKARVVLEAPVKHAVVRERAKDEVQRRRAELRDEQDGEDLAVDVVARPLRGGCCAGGELRIEVGI